MQCDRLKRFQGDVDAALHALRSAKGPYRISKLEAIKMRVTVAKRALVEHRNTCLLCANEK